MKPSPGQYRCISGSSLGCKSCSFKENILHICNRKPYLSPRLRKHFPPNTELVEQRDVIRELSITLTLMPYLETSSGGDAFLFRADKPPRWHSLSEKLLEPPAPGDHRAVYEYLGGLTTVPFLQFVNLRGTLEERCS